MTGNLLYVAIWTVKTTLLVTISPVQVILWKESLIKMKQKQVIALELLQNSPFEKWARACSRWIA